MASSARRRLGRGGPERVAENWERLVRAALKRDRAGGAGPESSAAGHAAAGVGLASVVPPSLGRTTNIEQILQAADDIEDDDPNVARIPMSVAAMRQQRQEQEASCKATEDHRSEFDAAKPPPFRIGDVRAAVPAHCWRKSPLRSLSYVARDVVVFAALAAAAWCVDSWAVWPLYWAVQGTMFWALFVLGHDCGHGSFSDSGTLNSVVGHLLHTFILVPYNGCIMIFRTIAYQRYEWFSKNLRMQENDNTW